MSFVITPELIEKINTLMDKGLSKGLGNRVPGEMCVEAAICYAMGEPHSDSPSCVNPVLRLFKIKLNDLDWSSPKARAKGLRRLAIAQLGTKENFNEREFLEKVICVLLRKINDSKFPQEWIDWKNDYLANKNRSDVASAYAAAHAAPAGHTAAYAAAYAAYEAARDTTSAARAAADAARAARAAALVPYATRLSIFAVTLDKFLADFCEEAVQILIEMKTPGSQWL